MQGLPRAGAKEVEMANKQFPRRLGWLGGAKGLVFATGAAHPVGPIEAGGWEPR